MLGIVLRFPLVDMCGIRAEFNQRAHASANGLVGTGFASRYQLGPVSRCKATTSSSFSLNSNRVTTNLLS